jgi:hypothetical protein
VGEGGGRTSRWFGIFEYQSCWWIFWGGKKNEFLRSLYLEQLEREETAVFRLNVFQDLMREEVYDAVRGFQLAKLFLSELRERGAYCLYVTFIPRVASLDFVISLVAMPSPEEPEKPSYKILPGGPPSEYMAIRIAAKYRLLYDELRGMLS